MRYRGAVLLVEDSIYMLDLYRKELDDSGYNVTGVFYEGRETRLPNEKFDVVISDGLFGDWRRVLGETNADKKILLSRGRDQIKEASNTGFIAILKSKGIEKVLEEIR